MSYVIYRHRGGGFNTQYRVIKGVIKCVKVSYWGVKGVGLIHRWVLLPSKGS
jgi:hypothetical protein